MTEFNTSEMFLANIVKNLSAIEFRNFFDIEASAQWIDDNKFKRIALQLPDEFLCVSTSIVKDLEVNCRNSVETFILADTTYRSCCVDMVAAEQAKADCIIHYGDACMSEFGDRFPVRFVYGLYSIYYNDLEQSLSKHKDQFALKCCLLYDTLYVSEAEALEAFIKQQCPNREVISCDLVQSTSSSFKGFAESGVKKYMGRQVTPGADVDSSLIFIGEPQSALLPLWLMTFPGFSNVYVYSPLSRRCTFDRCEALRSLRKRLYLIEKLRDALRIGIVVNSLELVGYGTVLKRTRELCRVSGKDAYVLAVGKINVAKLSNFATEIDAYIVLSCPYGIILDTSSYCQPVVGFFEAEMAFNTSRNWYASDGWTGEFRNLLTDRIESTNEKTDVSLITGKLRQIGIKIGDVLKESESKVVSIRRIDDQLTKRTWRGLDNDGVDNENEIDSLLREGRSGTSIRYTSEPSC